MEEQAARVVRSKAQAKANYDRQSRFYDYIAGPSEKPFKNLGVQLLAPQPGEILLEIGYGTGYCLAQLARQVGVEGQVYGIDMSPGMQAVAAARIDKLGLSDTALLDLGDATQLPYEDRFFDGLFMSFVLELFDNPEIPGVLDESLRVLKPGGRVCVVALAKSKQPGLAERIYEWAHGVFPVVLDCRPIFAQPSVEAAGFSSEQVIRKSMWGLPVEIVLGRKR